jgi:hypothetical protein
LEPLQEQAEQMITTLEIEKSRMEQAHSESIQVLKEHVTMQVMETLTEKSVQAKKQVDELAKQVPGVGEISAEGTH